MVAIPGGTFLMGSPAGEKGRTGDEGPQHPVALKPFWMGAKEVTLGRVRPVLADAAAGPERRRRAGDAQERRRRDAPHQALLRRDVDARPRGAPGPRHHLPRGHAVLPLAVDEDRQGLPAADRGGVGVRRPRRHETAYFFGETRPTWATTPGSPTIADSDPQACGKKKPNPWGLYDIYGNVSEYCLDEYQKDYYSKFSLTMATLQPVNIPGNRRFGHVVRGGSWVDDATRCRSAARAGVRQELDQARPAATAEHLVADQRRLRRLPHCATAGGAGEPQGLSLEDHARQQVTAASPARRAGAGSGSTRAGPSDWQAHRGSDTLKCGEKTGPDRKERHRVEAPQSLCRS